MKSCANCGKDNADLATACVGCGTNDFKNVGATKHGSEPGESPTYRATPPTGGSGARFFRWRPASIILIIFIVIYWLVALLDLWMGRGFSHDGDLPKSHFMYRGTFWNLVVAVLCFAGRRMMKRQTRNSLSVTAILVMAALLIVIRTWIAELRSGHNPFPITEAILLWLPLIYVIIYAYRESKIARTDDLAA